MVLRSISCSDMAGDRGWFTSTVVMPMWELWTLPQQCNDSCCCLTAPVDLHLILTLYILPTTVCFLPGCTDTPPPLTPHVQNVLVGSSLATGNYCWCDGWQKDQVGHWWESERKCGIRDGDVLMVITNAMGWRAYFHAVWLHERASGP